MTDFNERLLQIPPLHLIELPAIAEAVGDFDRLTAGLHAAHDKLGELRDQHAAALHQEATTLADAVRTGGADPGSKRGEKLARDIDAQVRVIEATQQALAQSRRDLVKAVEEHRAEWVESLERRMVDVRAGFLAAVDRLENAHTELANIACLQMWAREFPERARWNPIAYVRKHPAFVDPNNEPFDVVEVIDAVRVFAQPPEPPKPAPEHVPPGGQQSGAVPRRYPVATPSVVADVSYGGGR